jgi:hypothetical protein
MDFKDLSQHSGTLVWLIGSFAVLCGILIGAIYKLNNRMIAGIMATQKQCQDNLPLLYAPKLETETHINKLFGRQDKLRDETLPQTYVLRNEMYAWNLVSENGFKAVTARLDAACLKIDRLLERGK